MFTNTDCTVFNKRLDRETRTDIWHKTYIRGVYWEETDGVSRDKTSGVTNASSLFAAIPADADTEGKSYLSPNEYKAASPEAAFTFAPEDIIIKGIVPENVGDGISIADLQRKYDNFHFITECKDFRFGGQPHLEVSGK